MKKGFASLASFISGPKTDLELLQGTFEDPKDTQEAQEFFEFS